MSNTERDAEKDTESMRNIIRRQEGDGTLPTFVVENTPDWKSKEFGRYNGPTEEQQKKIDQKNEEKKNTELKKRLESVINSFSSKIPGKNHHKPYSMSKQDKMLRDISSRTSVAARKEAEMIKAARGHTQTKDKYTPIPPKGGKYRRRKTNRHKPPRRKTKRRKTKRRRSYRR